MKSLELPGGGRQATELTLRIMAQMARNAIADPRLRELALSLIGGMAASDEADYIQDVANYVRGNIRIVNEPDEMLVHPSRMISWIEKGIAGGDCDDLALFAGAMLTALGIRARFKAVFRTDSGSFQHVFVEYKISEADPWRPMDLTIDLIPVYPPEFIVCEI
jgi:transglutaminase-like putative cysteine protease